MQAFALSYSIICYMNLFQIAFIKFLSQISLNNSISIVFQNAFVCCHDQIATFINNLLNVFKFDCFPLAISSRRHNFQYNSWDYESIWQKYYFKALRFTAEKEREREKKFMRNLMFNDNLKNNWSIHSQVSKAHAHFNTNYIMSMNEK